MNPEPGKGLAEHDLPRSFSTPRKIAILRAGALGDFVLTLPVLHSLRRARPKAGDLLIARPSFACLAAPQQTIDHDSAELAFLYVPESQPSPRVKDLLADVELMVAFSTDPTGVLQCHLDRLVGGGATVFDPRPSTRHPTHITQHLLQSLQPLGVASLHSPPCVHIAEPARRLAAARVGTQQRPLIMIHPGSGGHHKCWPVERFADLARILHTRGMGVVTLCGPADAQLTSRMPPPVLRPADPLGLAAMLRLADLFVGNDSGPGHLAAAVGTPTLSLFGPTEAAVWKPCGQRARVLRAPGGDLRQLDVHSVLKAVREMLR